MPAYCTAPWITCSTRAGRVTSGGYRSASAVELSACSVDRSLWYATGTATCESGGLSRLRLGLVAKDTFSRWRALLRKRSRPCRTSLTWLSSGEVGTGPPAAAIPAGHADYPSFRHRFPDPARRARALALFEGTVQQFGASWYREVLSVRPESRRRALGTRLLEPILERADRDGVPCHLETSGSRQRCLLPAVRFDVDGLPLEVLGDGPPTSWQRFQKP